MNFYVNDSSIGNDFGKQLPVHSILYSSSYSNRRSLFNLVSFLSVKKKKKKISSVSLSVIWADGNRQGSPEPLYSSFVNGRWGEELLKLIALELDRSLNGSLSFSADTVRCLLLTVPVAGERSFYKMAFCLKTGVWFWWDRVLHLKFYLMKREVAQGSWQ